jgi:hypothetical protein
LKLNDKNILEQTGFQTAKTRRRRGIICFHRSDSGNSDFPFYGSKEETGKNYQE